MNDRPPPFHASKGEILLALWVLAVFALYLWQFRGLAPSILAIVLPT